MPNRRQLERRGTSGELTAEQEWFLLTGWDYFLDLPYGGEANPDRDAIEADWAIHGERLTAQHRAEGKRTLPWAEKFLRGKR